MRLTCAAVVCVLLASPAFAVEGPTAAGPIGGTDIRSALQPPPGVYGGVAFVAARTTTFVDGRGDEIGPLKTARLFKAVGGPFFAYVPETTVWGGSLTFSAVLPLSHQRGNLFDGERKRSQDDVGDPYVELSWSKYFGTPRASKDPKAFPILGGLSVLAGIGVVAPIGQFSSANPLSQSLSAGTNIWDVAPSFGLTYTTAPILAEGTEFSAKLFWNNYVRNRETDYRTGDLINLDFAVTEHIGRVQAGLTGFYAKQVEDDRVDGARIPPDGRRGELLQLGGVVAYDLPEYASSVKVKALTSAKAENTVKFWGIVTSFVTKF